MKELAPSLRQSGGAFLLKTAKHVFHSFPYFICQLSANEKWQLRNDKWKIGFLVLKPAR
jgi:hypothetical protein